MGSAERIDVTYNFKGPTENVLKMFAKPINPVSMFAWSHFQEIERNMTLTAQFVVMNTYAVRGPDPRNIAFSHSRSLASLFPRSALYLRERPSPIRNKRTENKNPRGVQCTEGVQWRTTGEVRGNICENGRDKMVWKDQREFRLSTAWKHKIDLDDFL